MPRSRFQTVFAFDRVGISMTGSADPCAASITRCASPLRFVSVR
ncbi:MAG: hypothetical protein R3B49_10295 [Phycisphaerales bacterium]